MFISDKRQEVMVRFATIEEGQCFVYPEDNSVCMRVEESTKEYNAVDLKNGQIFFVAEGTEVIKVNSRMEIW